MQLSSLSLLALLVSLIPLLAPSGLWAQEGEFDQLERVQELQRQALMAVRAEDWDRARELAEVVLTLDDSEFTAESRLVLVQALENERQFGAALYELKQYLGLPLSPRDLRRGERIQKRLGAKREADLVGQPLPRAKVVPVGQPKIASAVGVLLGGVAMSITGSYFIGVDLRWEQQGVRSGTWAAIGTPLLAFGVSLDIVGVVLLRKARTPGASLADLRRFERRPHLSISWRSEQIGVSFGGAW